MPFIKIRNCLIDTSRISGINLSHQPTYEGQPYGSPQLLIWADGTDSEWTFEYGKSPDDEIQRWAAILGDPTRAAHYGIDLKLVDSDLSTQTPDGVRRIET